MKLNFTSTFFILLISLSSYSTGQNEKKDTLKPVVVVTKETLHQKADSLKQPYVDSTLYYKAKVAQKDKENEKKIEELQRLQKKKKVVYVKKAPEVIVKTDTVYIKKESFIQKINPFKKKK